MAIRPLLHPVIALLVTLAAAFPAFAEVSSAQEDDSNLAPRTALAFTLLDPAAPIEAPPLSFSLQTAQLTPEAGEKRGEAFAAGNVDSGWRWRRASGAEYTGIFLGLAGTLYVETKYGTPDPQWRSRNGFDEGIRDGLRLGSRSARHAAHTASDVLMGLMIGAPVLEPFATLGIRDSRWEALWQTEMINLESLTFTALVSTVMQNLLLPRERPFVRNCQDGKCEDGQVNRSMPSGHVAFAMTGAGLVCNHHRYQSFYGDTAADRAACTAGIVLATADGFLRIMADRHYATDVLVGTGIGLFAGFVLPRWLHYYWPQTTSEAEAKDEDKSLFKHLMLSPQVYNDGAGLTCGIKF